IFSLEKGNQGTTNYAVVRINGTEVDRFNLDKISHKYVKYYPAKVQSNIIEFKDGKIRDREDNSPDQIAVRTGWISNPGQTSICLPPK
ncbi:NusG domain II-containing protein, partial [Enterococcus faecalis]